MARVKGIVAYRTPAAQRPYSLRRCDLALWAN